MAILSALLSLLSRKVGDLLQAIFGWSIAGLFGRLPSKKRTGLAVALVLSIAWPPLIVGIAAPRAAAFAITLVPLHDLVSARVLRFVWLGLAILAPLGVAVLTRWVAPPAQKKGGFKALLVSSVPLTIGFAISFLITLFVVPALKIAAAFKGWSDEHVYLLIDRGAYEQVLKAVRAACATAEMELDERPVPLAMALPLKVLTWFARGALAPIVAQDPRMLESPDLTVYLYPADLLLRGIPARVAQVRALLVTEMARAPAHLVEEPAGQRIEDEIHRMWELVDRHHGPGELGDAASARVREIAVELRRAELPIEQWSLLHIHLTLLERAVSGGPRLVDPEISLHREDPIMTMETKHDEGVTDLLRDAMGEAKDLVKLEVELAKSEAREELAEAKVSALAFGGAFMGATIGLTMLMVAIVLAFGPRSLPALAIGVALVAAAGVAAFVGYQRLPKKPLGKTFRRLEKDTHMLKEHTA